jgi:hypothetical protein
LCLGILKVNERKADPEILVDLKWNWRSRAQGGPGVNSLGQEGLERGGCRPMPQRGQKVKKKKFEIFNNSFNMISNICNAQVDAIYKIHVNTL